MKGHTEIIKFLLEHGANVHACENGAVKWANRNGHIEVVNLLKEWSNK